MTTIVQGTIETFDAASGGTLLLDDGQRVRFEAAAIVAGGWRLVRSGQRVTAHLAAEDPSLATAITQWPSAPAT